MTLADMIRDYRIVNGIELNDFYQEEAQAIRDIESGRMMPSEFLTQVIGKELRIPLREELVINSHPEVDIIKAEYEVMEEEINRDNRGLGAWFFKRNKGLRSKKA